MFFPPEKLISLSPLSEFSGGVDFDGRMGYSYIYNLEPKLAYHKLLLTNKHISFPPTQSFPDWDPQPAPNSQTLTTASFRPPPTAIANWAPGGEFAALIDKI